MHLLYSAYFAFFIIAMTGCEKTEQLSVKPAGEEKTLKTKVLEKGADLLQDNSPLNPMSIYLVGFHAAKHDPSHQMEAHHYCHQLNEDFAQCVLFDGNTERANLIGIEYIISATLFETLPENEKEYWHPHNFEILSGQLIAPHLPDVAEKELMKSKMNSYGKTWHVWNSAPFGKAGDDLPLGDAILEWSFNREGEALPRLIEQRDQRFKMTTAAKKNDRVDLAPLAHPQFGVDALKDTFPHFPAQKKPR